MKSVLLANSKVYRLFSSMLANEKNLKNYVDKFIKPHKGDKVLDIGCGVGRFFEQVPETRFFGFDHNEDYILHAQHSYGSEASFVRMSINQALDHGYRDFDIVVATGVLHHLSDAEAREMFELAHSALREGGRLITLDGCWLQGQSLFEKLLLRLDRGKFIRTQQDYTRLAQHAFAQVRSGIYRNLLRVPYTHVVMECSR